MNVNGLGGAASLPLTLPSTASPTSATGSVGHPGTSSGASPGEVRLPGQSRSAAAAAAEEAAKKAKELPKPAPLPPLRGLTVAEIRAMLGVASLPGQLQAGSGATPSIISASLDRYA